ncbi:MAG: DUF1592 domain-containing protein, partial [Verrucomicrobiota bacterium]|nr:DUF1592 domain-containing protein [Verrucomicrobiota bacterium]
VSREWDDAATQAAIEVANHVVANLDALSRSRAGDADRAERVRAFCRQFVETAFRRPLTADEKRIFVDERLRDGNHVAADVKRIVLLALKSPRFAYPGLGGGKGDAFESASRLSFALWDSLPDLELFKSAAEGRLQTRGQVAEQANRLLADARARAKVHDFLQQWLQMNHAEDLSKDAALYPGFTPEIIADLRTSLNLFLEDAVWNGKSGFRDLLLSEHLYLNDRLAEFYGAEVESGGDFQKVPFDARQRSGVVTHPYLLAAFSYPKSSSPIHRGVFLTRNVVGRALKPPQVAVEFKENDFPPHLTMREKVEELTRSAACQTCHSVINPLGFTRTIRRGRPLSHRGK